MSPLGALSQAWTSAEAALPLGWRIVQLRLDLVMPDGSEQWIASAAFYSADGMESRDEYENAYGPTPHQALLRLAEDLKPLRGPTTGG